MFSKIIPRGKGPTRLFIGGVHGKEGLSTVKALQCTFDEDVKEGTLVIYNCDESRYISTLNPLYYQSKVGKEILYLIDLYKPDMYVELHCYKPESYSTLTNLDRMRRVGVPPLIELKDGVLIGSVSPQIRTTVFKKEDVCITLEMPCNPSDAVLKIYVDFLKVLAGAGSRKDLESKARKIYPEQVETSQRYAREIFGDYPPF